MSSVPISTPAINLIGSAAAGPSGTRASNERGAEAAGRSFAADQRDRAARSLDHIGEAEVSADRDADGRRPWEGPPEAPEQSGADENSGDGRQERTDPSSPRRPQDAFGVLGNSLDLEA